jgi:hypothetical protein
MANLIGVLGEASGVTVATHTAYTVPSGKAAKVQIMYRGEAGSSSTLQVLVNGLVVFTTGALTSGYISHSTRDTAHVSQAVSDIDGSTAAKTVAPYVREFLLSAGDLVQYVIGTTAFASMNFQVVGAEIDVV